MRGFGRSGVVEEIRAAGGEIFAVTSEPQSLASEAQDTWELEYQAVGDPHHEILGDCRENDRFDLYIGDTGVLERHWSSHPNGIFQAGVLALAQDGRVLYRWHCRPTHQNRGGASGRVTAPHVWSRIRDALTSDTDAAWDTDPPLDAPDAFWPYFVAQLFAHGWFIKPKRFPLGRPDDKPSARVSAMKPRLIGFAAAWAICFVLLPARRVFLALVGYAVAITPAVRRVNREFQHVPAGRAPEPGGRSLGTEPPNASPPTAKSPKRSRRDETASRVTRRCAWPFPKR